MNTAAWHRVSWCLEERAMGPQEEDEMEWTTDTTAEFQPKQQRVVGINSDSNNSAVTSRHNRQAGERETFAR